MSPSQFADTVGLNRSAISHVLNNRNKPGYDFMQKVYKAYPEWDFDWLLFNSKATNKPTPSAQKHKPKEIEAPLPKETSNQAYSQGSLFSTPEDPTQNANKPTIRKVVTKTILIYNDGTFDIYQNNLQ